MEDGEVWGEGEKEVGVTAGLFIVLREDKARRWILEERGGRGGLGGVRWGREEEGGGGEGCCSSG